MFSRSHNKSFSKSHRVTKPGSFSKDAGVSKSRRSESRRRPSTMASSMMQHESAVPSLTSPIVTLVIGREQRLFAAHEHALLQSPFFQQALQNADAYQDGSPTSAFFRSPTTAAASPGQVSTPGSPATLSSTSAGKRLVLPDDEPEIFSCVLEYLYKGDYFPRLVRSSHHHKHKGGASTGTGTGGTWELELPPSTPLPADALFFRDPATGSEYLKDTVVYCAAERFGLDELKRIALRKQGLQAGIPCSTILASARYAYDHTPDTDAKLRAHYLALIIRSRATFKSSGTMQLEMYNGGSALFFDLFVALCNHVDDVAGSAQGSPRSNRFF